MEQTIIESSQRLSSSKLWQWQADYFAQNGVAAWHNAVPFYVSSNPFIARCYAQVIACYLKEIERLPHVDTEQPVYIVELGAGAGQFSFYCIKQISTLCESLQLKLKPCYVMTDFTETNINFWANHAALQPYVEAGWLDFAQFDVDRPQPLRLRYSQRDITPEQPGAAVICIANYVFDSVRHDVFHVDSGELYEQRASLSLPTSLLNDYQPEQYLAAVALSFDKSVIASEDYYANPLWNELLVSYVEEQSLQGSFMFATAMLSALDYLERLGQGNLFLLSGDKGYLDTVEIQGRTPPTLAKHGSFSVNVNFDLLKRYTELKRGHSFHPSAGTNFLTCAYLLSDKPESYVETRVAVKQHIHHWGPGDFFSFYRAIYDAEKTDLKGLLSLFRMSDWDPHIISRLVDKLYPQLSQADDRQRKVLHEGICCAEEQVYAKPGMKNHYFNLAMLCYGLQDYDNAARLYQQSLSYSGPSYEAFFNLGLAYYFSADNNAALTAFSRAQELETAGSDAKDWLHKLQTTNQCTQTVDQV